PFGLLEHVHQFVCEQPATLQRAGSVLASAEGYVGTDRVGAGMQSIRRARRTLVAVHPDACEVVPEPGAHRGGLGRIQTPAATVEPLDGNGHFRGVAGPGRTRRDGPEWGADSRRRPSVGDPSSVPLRAV